VVYPEFKPSALFWSLELMVLLFFTCVLSGAMVIMSRNGKTFLLLVSSGIIFLSAFAVWTVLATDSMSSFRFLRTAICDEVDEDFQPAGVSDHFSYGTRQLCLWFEYCTEYDSCGMNIKWYYRDQLVSRESVVISDSEGRRTFCLLREDGFPLPGGKYRVRIELNGRKLTTLKFSIENKEA